MALPSATTLRGSALFASEIDKTVAPKTKSLPTNSTRYTSFLPFFAAPLYTMRRSFRSCASGIIRFAAIFCRMEVSILMSSSDWPKNLYSPLAVTIVSASASSFSCASLISLKGHVVFVASFSATATVSDLKLTKITLFAVPRRSFWKTPYE